MSKNKMNDNTLYNLYKSFGEDLQNNQEVSSYQELHNLLHSLLIEREKQGLLEEERLKTLAKLNELQGKDYLSSITLGVSLAALTVSLFLGVKVVDPSYLYLICFVLVFAITFICYKAISVYHKRCQKVAYYKFKLDCIEKIKEGSSAKQQNAIINKT